MGQTFQSVIRPTGKSVPHTLAGDWNGNGVTDLGNAPPTTDSFGWRFDLNYDRRWVWGATHADQWWRWGNPTVHIGVVGDWDGDRLDDPGVFRTDSGLWQFTNRVQQGGSIAPSVEGFGAGYGACRWLVGNDPSI